MLVNFKEMLEKAADSDYAIPGFNVFGYEDAIAVIEAAEELNAPVILMSNRDSVAHMPVDVMGAIYTKLAEKAKVPVCIHLDHSWSFEEAARAIKGGYTSVMYDGSKLPLDENIKNTKEIVKMAHTLGVSVEAEVGAVGYVGVKGVETEPADAKKFVEETGVDALAISIGNVHKMEFQGAELDFDRLDKIEEAIKTPLVIHGSTGIVDEDLAKLSKSRVAKINIGTALRMGFGNTLRDEMNKNPEQFDRIKLFPKPMQVVKEKALEKMKLLGLG